jgi:hypothetical protein
LSAPTQPAQHRRTSASVGITVAGAIGGGVGGQLLTAVLPMLANSSAGVEIAALASQAIGGGIAGAIVTAVIGALKNNVA